MPAKKKTKGKKKKKKKVVEEEDVFVSCYKDFDQQELNLLKSMQTKTDFVNVDLKLMDWKFADFSVLVRTSTKLSSIKRKIEERHGHIDDDGFELYRAPPHKKNILLNMDLSLEEIGIVGGAKEDDARYVLFYDFKPALTGPLLNKEPALVVPAEYQHKPDRQTGILDSIVMS
jgi:hypothetical protein